MTLQPIWHKRKHALNSALDHSEEITDTQHGIRTLLNAHALPDLSGIISDVQHGVKTTIPNAHHSKLHQNSHFLSGDDYFSHGHPSTMVQTSDATEVSTSSTTYVLLQSKVFISPNITLYFITWTHNAKNEGTLASRGADYKFTRQVGAGTEYDIVTYRWTDALADYKTMCVTFYTLIVTSAGSTITIRVYWKVDDASYPAWSKDRFLNILPQVSALTLIPP